jgi:hypothetical protein
MAAAQPACDVLVNTHELKSAAAHGPATEHNTSLVSQNMPVPPLLLLCCCFAVLQGVFPPGTFPSLGLPDGWYCESPARFNVLQ